MDNENGNSELPAEEVEKIIDKEDAAQAEDQPKPRNRCKIEDGILTVTVYLESDNEAYIKAIGTLVLTQDLVKNYFGQKAVVEQAMKERSTLIRPSGPINPRVA